MYVSYEWTGEHTEFEMAVKRQSCTLPLHPTCVDFLHGKLRA